jgi:hypothetical protein
MSNFINLIDLNSNEEFNETELYGDKMSLNDFLTSCHNGEFIDYDGYASEIIINGYIVYDDAVSPSEYLSLEGQLKQLQEEKGPIFIIWYNK